MKRGKTMKNQKMEQFKNNLEGQGFSQEFIQKALEYFTELEKEKKTEKLESIEEVIDYNARSFTFTWNTKKK